MKHSSITVLSQIEVSIEKVFGQSDMMKSNKPPGLVLEELNYEAAEISIAGHNLSLKIASVSANVMCFQKVSREHQRNNTVLRKVL